MRLRVAQSAGNPRGRRDYRLPGVVMFGLRETRERGRKGIRERNIEIRWCFFVFRPSHDLGLHTSPEDTGWDVTGGTSRGSK